jgi:hypothetical protein
MLRLLDLLLDQLLDRLLLCHLRLDDLLRPRHLWQT